MARLQILELPEGASDERPPFVLVVDEVATGPDGELLIKSSDFTGVREEIGARAVLVFEETVDIPANDVPLGADGNPLFVQDVQVQDGPHLATERTGIARDMDRLAKWKHELIDALGMDHTRDWDDIRNTAAGLRKERDAQAEAINRVRQLHKPVIHRDQEICRDCSAYDFVGQSTDNAPVAYDQCDTIKALAPDA